MIAITCLLQDRLDQVEVRAYYDSSVKTTRPRLMSAICHPGLGSTWASRVNSKSLQLLKDCPNAVGRCTNVGIKPYLVARYRPAFGRKAGALRPKQSPGCEPRVCTLATRHRSRRMHDAEVAFWVLQYSLSSQGLARVEMLRVTGLCFGLLMLRVGRSGGGKEQGKLVDEVMGL